MQPGSLGARYPQHISESYIPRDMPRTVQFHSCTVHCLIIIVAIFPFNFIKHHKTFFFQNGNGFVDIHAKMDPFHDLDSHGIMSDIGPCIND